MLFLKFSLYSERKAHSLLAAAQREKVEWSDGLWLSFPRTRLDDANAHQNPDGNGNNNPHSKTEIPCQTVVTGYNPRRQPAPETCEHGHPSHLRCLFRAHIEVVLELVGIGSGALGKLLECLSFVVWQALPDYANEESDEEEEDADHPIS